MKRLKDISIFITLLLFTLLCFAQREKIDSLDRCLTPSNDSDYINRLNELSKAYYYINPDSTRYFSLQALAKAEAINNAKGEATAYIHLAWANWFLANDYPGMALYSKKAIALLERSPYANDLAYSWFSLGNSYWAQAKFSQAVESFEIAGKIYAELSDEMNVANMFAYIAWTEEARGYYKKSLDYSWKWYQIAKKYKDNANLDVWGELYRYIGDFNTSMNYFRQAAQFVRGTSTLDQLADYTQAIGEIFFQEGLYDSARVYYQLASTYMPGKQNFLNARIGELFAASKNYDSAFYYLTLDLNIAKKSGHLNQAMWVLLRTGRVYFETANHESAIHTANELLHLARQTGARQYIRDGHFLLYKNFLQTGRRHPAFDHLQQYLLIKDSIDKDLSAQRLAVYRIRSAKEQHQSRIDLLNQEKKSQHQRFTQQKKFLVAGIAALLIIGLVLFRNLVLKRKNEKQRLEHELEIQKLESDKSKAELQQHASELEMQVLRTQMNPHFIFNSLNSINRFILQNNKALASEYLTKFSKLVRMILQNSQTSLITLESELEALKLYLDLEVLRFEQHFDYKITAPDDIDTDVLKVPPLIIQPYAENAIWHGLMHKEEKGQLDIEISQEDGHLLFKITDDGIGRKQAAMLASKSATSHKSMGLKITADRIAMLNKLNGAESPVTIKDLTNADGTSAGTEVLIKIPLM